MESSIPLLAIEELLNEFHYPSTSNVRKREIEAQLIEFQNNANTWPQCLYHLTNVSNQYLWFFNISTIEMAITRRWYSLKSPERHQIRNTLWSCYTHLPADAPKIKREKIGQLIALIGKREFPDEYPSYMDDIMNLLSTHFNLGITLIRTTSDELVSTRDDVSTGRKKKFISGLTHYMSDIFDIFNQFLIVCSYRINNRVFDTNAAEFHNIAASMPSDDISFSVSVEELLTCIQHLFTWVQLDTVVSENLIFNLFDLANWRECASNVSVTALIAISEMFYRQIALPRAKSIAKAVKMILEQNNLKNANEMYQDRLTELLKLFTAQHWNQWVNSDDIYDVVTLLYHFTFSGYGALAFTERLTIWNPIIQGLASTGFGRYIEIVHLLISGILRKMQFRFDQDAELDVLDNESLDDNMETEWQHYLSQCIETIVLTAEGRPFQVFEQVYNDWQRPFEMFISLEKSHDGTSLTITDYHKCHLIHCVTRDLSSLCQTLVSLIPILQNYPDELPDNLHQLAYNLVYSVGFLSRSRLHGLSVALPQLTTDFIDIYAQILSAIRCFLGWSPALQNEQQLKQLIEHVAFTLQPPSHTTHEPKIITLAAAQLLLSITSTLRPKCALESTSFGQLIHAGNNLNHLDRHAAICIQQSIVNCFALPWMNVPNTEQDYEQRKLLLQEYIDCLAQDLLRLDHTVENGQENKIIKITTTILPALKDIIDYYKDQSSSVKNMLLPAFKPAIVKSMSLFNSFGAANIEIATCVLDFCFSIIRTLQMQLGTNYVKEMLGIFLEASTREQLTLSRLKSIDKLLQMLLLVVQQPGNSTLTLLPGILNLALEFVMPLVMQEKSSPDLSDVAISLFSLFDGILHNRWQYFYKSQVLRGFSPGASDAHTPIDDGPQHPEQLLAILTAYGNALVNSNDPHITRILLTSLQSLNEKWKLFSREFFKTNLLASFHCALINALIAPEGALHIDYLMNVLFTMGQVNNETLHASFVSLGFSGQSKMVKDICLSMDLPTFSQNMTQLIQDARYNQYLQ